MRRKTVSPSIYTKDYYQKYNHGYEISRKSLDMLPGLKNFLKTHIRKGEKVLDVGCGRGESIYLCNKIGASCAGIDYSPDAITIAKTNLKKFLPNKPSNLKVADAKHIPFQNDKFDVVIMFDIVEHLYPWELQKALSEVRRVLKGGGLLLVHTSPNRNNMQPVKLLAHLAGIKLISEKYHVNEQTPHQLSRTLRSHFKSAKVSLFKDKKYYSNQMRERGSILKIIANCVDTLLDSRIFDLLFKIRPAAELLATDIYVVCEK